MARPVLGRQQPVPGTLAAELSSPPLPIVPEDPPTRPFGGWTGRPAHGRLILQILNVIKAFAHLGDTHSAEARRTLEVDDDTVTGWVGVQGQSDIWCSLGICRPAISTTQSGWVPPGGLGQSKGEV